MPDINQYAPRSGRVIGEDGKVYNIVDLLKNAGGGGGDMQKEIYDQNDNGIVDAAESVPWSGVTNKPSTFPPQSHTHSISDVTNLQDALDGKADASHTHSISQVSGLQSALDGKANAVSSIEPIADPTAATVEDVANKINEILAGLKGE